MDINILLQVYTSITVLAVVHSAPVAGIRKSDCNGVDMFWDKVAKNCKKCIFCGTGYRRNMNCGGGSGGIIDCIPCSTGFFQDSEHFDGTRCRLCISCSITNLKEEKACESTSNAQCGTCKLGFGRDPWQPSDIGCTSCEHLPTTIEGCGQKTKESTTTSTTTKQKTTSVRQISAPIHSTAQAPKNSSSTHNTTSLQLPIKTHQGKTENGFPVTIKKGSNKVVIHVTREAFGIVLALLLLGALIVVFWKIMKSKGYKPRLPKCRKSVEIGENNNDPERRPTQTKGNIITNKQMETIPEEQSSNESESGEDVPFLKPRPRPTYNRSTSAPAILPCVKIDSVKQFAFFKKNPSEPRKRKEIKKKSPDEELVEKALRISKGQLLADLSPEIQSKLQTALNPDRKDSMVENWRHLALRLAIANDIIDNFQDRMGSVFTHMSCRYPDTTMKTFLEAVQQLQRPKLVRTICSSIIDEDEKKKQMHA